MRREAILFLTPDETLEVLLHGLTWSVEYDLLSFLLGEDAGKDDKRAAAKLELVDLHSHSGLSPMLEALNLALPETQYVLRFRLGEPVELSKPEVDRPVQCLWPHPTARGEGGHLLACTRANGHDGFHAHEDFVGVTW